MRLLQERAPPGNRMTPSTQIVLGLETSCDETAASGVAVEEASSARPRGRILSDVVHTQAALHARMVEPALSAAEVLADLSRQAQGDITMLRDCFVSEGGRRVLDLNRVA